MFRRVWPVIYGEGKRSIAHRRAFDELISLVWPLKTAQQFFGIRPKPNRSKFHNERLEMAVYIANGIWNKLAVGWRKPQNRLVFDKQGVEAYIRNVVSTVTNNLWLINTMVLMSIINEIINDLIICSSHVKKKNWTSKMPKWPDSGLPPILSNSRRHGKTIHQSW